MNTSKSSAKLFWTIFIMLFFSYITMILLRDSKDALMVTTLGVEKMAFLKQAAKLASIAFGGILLLFLRGGNFLRVTLGYFWIQVICLALFTILLQPNSATSQNPFVISTFYMIANAGMVIPIALTWGVANQYYSFKLAALHYPIFGAIIPTIASSIASNIPVLILSSITNKQNIFSLILITTVSLTLLLLAATIPLCRKELKIQEKGKKIKMRYYLGFASLLFAISFAAPFSDLIFKMQIKELNFSISEYNQFMGNFSLKLDIWKSIVGFFSIGLGILLYFDGKRMLGILLGALLLITTLFGGFGSLTSNGVAQIGKIGYASSLGIFMVFIELLYFRMPAKYRFMAKVSISLIVVAFASWISALAPTFVILFSEKASWMQSYALLFIAAMIVSGIALFFTLKWKGKEQVAT